MTSLGIAPLTRFDDPDTSTAPTPPETRGLARDGVRLLVATTSGLTHARFSDLGSHLEPGDLVVVNNSATLAAEFDGTLAGKEPVVVHAAAELENGTWVVELRTAPDARRAILHATPGDQVTLKGLARLELIEPYPAADSSPTGHGNRLWRARVSGPRTLRNHMLRHGRPIAYGYLDQRYSLADYQSVFGVVPGSAEMPSAGRPFTPELVTSLVAHGIGVVAVTLHTGVSSQEAGEKPQPEWFRVSPAAARLVNLTREAGSRVVAVGTTVTRALESAAGPGGVVHAAEGWTERVVSRADPARVVGGLITGWHDPQASHLLLVEAVAGQELTQRAYDEARTAGYLWHEFGDSGLLLP